MVLVDCLVGQLPVQCLGPRNGGLPLFAVGADLQDQQRQRAAPVVVQRGQHGGLEHRPCRDRPLELRVQAADQEVADQPTALGHRGEVHRHVRRQLVQRADAGVEVRDPGAQGALEQLPQRVGALLQELDHRVGQLVQHHPRVVARQHRGERLVEPAVHRAVDQGGGRDVQHGGVAAQLHHLAAGPRVPPGRCRLPARGGRPDRTGLDHGEHGRHQAMGRRGIGRNQPGGAPADVAGGDLVGEGQRVAEVLPGQVVAVGAVTPGVGEHVPQERVHPGERHADAVVHVRAGVVADRTRRDLRALTDPGERPAVLGREDVFERHRRIAAGAAGQGVQLLLDRGVEGEHVVRAHPPTAALLAVLVGHDAEDQFGDGHLDLPAAAGRHCARLVPVQPPVRSPIEGPDLQNDHGSVRTAGEDLAVVAVQVRVQGDAERHRDGVFDLQPRPGAAHAHRSAVHDRLCDRFPTLTGRQPLPARADVLACRLFGRRHRLRRQPAGVLLQPTQFPGHLVQQTNLGLGCQQFDGLVVCLGHRLRLPRLVLRRDQVRGGPVGADRLADQLPVQGLGRLGVDMPCAVGADLQHHHRHHGAVVVVQ